MPKTSKTPRKQRKVMTMNLSAPVKTAISRAVRRANPEEVKSSTLWNGSSSVAQTYGIQFNASVENGTNYALIPPIPQGTQVGQRVGEKISPRRLVCDFWVTATNYMSSVDMIARLFVLESHKIKDPALINSAAVDMDVLLNYGQAQDQFVGYSSQLSAPINKDAFKVHMNKTLKLSKTYGQNPTLTNAYLGAQQGPNANVIHHVRVVVKCPKVLHYETGTDTLPTNWAPFFNAGYSVPAMVNADGVDLGNTRLCVAWSSTLYYTDA